MLAEFRVLEYRRFGQPTNKWQAEESGDAESVLACLDCPSHFGATEVHVIREGFDSFAYRIRPEITERDTDITADELRIALRDYPEGCDDQKRAFAETLLVRYYDPDDDDGTS
jgi:hypothetical protein